MTPADQLAQKMDDARRAGKEGAGTHRNAGDCGRIGAEAMRLRAELNHTAQALQAAADRRADEWKRIAAKRETDHAAFAADNPHAEINLNWKGNK